MMFGFRRGLIALFTFLAGAYFFLVWALPEEIGKQTIAAYHEQALRSLQIIGIMSIGLGIINLFQVYGRVVLRRQRGWINAVALIVGFLVMMSAGLYEIRARERTLGFRQQSDAAAAFAKKLADEPTISQEKVDALVAFVHKAYLSENPSSTFGVASELNADEIALFSPARETLAVMSQSIHADAGADDAALRDQLRTIHKTLASVSPLLQQVGESTQSRSLPSKIASLLQQGIWVPLASAMFALLAFYIASAAYRSFRIRSLESACIMGSALLVILGQIPHGPIYISESLPAVRLWILEYVNAPAFRAIYFGSTVAGLAMAVRIWFSLERSPADVGGKR